LRRRGAGDPDGAGGDRQRRLRCDGRAHPARAAHAGAGEGCIGPGLDGGTCSMTTRRLALIVATSLAVLLFLASSASHPAHAQTTAALTGQVTSAGEGPLEGVLVSAKKAGSTVTITVVSDERGRYRFP